MTNRRIVENAIGQHEEFRLWFLDQNEKLHDDDLPSFSVEEDETTMSIDGNYYWAQDVIDGWHEWKEKEP